MNPKLKQVMSDVNKTFKDNIITEGFSHQKHQCIPFSSPRLNYMTYGGITRDRVVEFSGEEGGGKTTTALDIVANSQKLFLSEYKNEVECLSASIKITRIDKEKLNNLQERGVKKVLYVDCENSLMLDWATRLGVCVPDVIYLKPQSQSAEEIFQVILDIIQTGVIGLVIIDSLGVMVSEQAMQKDMTEKTYAGISGVLSVFVNKIVPLCKKYEFTLIGINQIREDMSSPWGGYKTTGGKAWKHACSIRLVFKKGSYINELGEELKRSSESPSGNLVCVSVAKTKVFVPNRLLGFYNLVYGAGVDSLLDYIDLAIKLGIIEKFGVWYYLKDAVSKDPLNEKDGNNVKCQGRAKVYLYLKNHIKILDAYTEYIDGSIINDLGVISDSTDKKAEFQKARI